MTPKQRVTDKVFERIGFGGGCHWCTEAVFRSLRGVDSIQQGFIRSVPPNESDSEAVLLEFDPKIIPPKALLDIHLRTHASTSNHSFRRKYRSAVYVFDDNQAASIQQAMAELQAGFEVPLVTKVLPFSAFTASDERYHCYYEKQPMAEFCVRYIDPKLDLLKSQFAHHMRQER